MFIGHMHTKGPGKPSQGERVVRFEVVCQYNCTRKVAPCIVCMNARIVLGFWPLFLFFFFVIADGSPQHNQVSDQGSAEEGQKTGCKDTPQHTSRFKFQYFITRYLKTTTRNKSYALLTASLNL